ncbi:MAG: YIP1 family protein [Flavobacteriales bacterium]
MILDDDYYEEKEEINLSDREVFTKIWFKPKMVFEFIHSKNYDKYMLLLVVLYGVGQIIDRMYERGFGSGATFVGSLFAVVIVGGLVGWLGALIYAALMSWTGSWIGGKSSTTPIYTVLAYSYIPANVGVILWGIAVLFIESGALDSISNSNLIEQVLLAIVLIIQVVLGIWSLGLLVIGLSEIQKISIGKAILNVFLPWLVIVLPLIILAIVLVTL